MAHDDKNENGRKGNRSQCRHNTSRRRSVMVVAATASSSIFLQATLLLSNGAVDAYASAWQKQNSIKTTLSTRSDSPNHGLSNIPRPYSSSSSPSSAKDNNNRGSASSKLAVSMSSHMPTSSPSSLSSSLSSSSSYGDNASIGASLVTEEDGQNLSSSSSPQPQQPSNATLAASTTASDQSSTSLSTPSSPSSKRRLLLERLRPSTSKVAKMSTAGVITLTMTTIAGILSMATTSTSAAIPKSLSTMMMNIFTTYQNALIQHPLTSKVLTGATLAILGDAIAQWTTKPMSTTTDSTNDTSSSSSSITSSSYDTRRAVSFALFDACYRVFQHIMFPTVIRLCKGSTLQTILPMAIGSRVAAAIERTMVYQLVIVPCLYYPVFFMFTGFIQGLSFKDTIDRMKSNYFRCWGRNLQFWIPTQFVLFGMINEHWQIPFACVMGMIWSLILSLTAGSAKKQQ